MPRYASTDPNFGLDDPQTKTYASTDPGFGLDEEPARSTDALRGATGIQATPWFAQRPGAKEGAALGLLGGPLALATVPAGAIAGALGLIPSFSEALNAAPAAGGAVGGVVGEAGGPIGAVGGAALGGAAGEAVNQLGGALIYSKSPYLTPEEAAKRMLVQGGTQAALEGGGRVLGALAGRAAAPFARSVNPRVVEAAERVGADLGDNSVVRMADGSPMTLDMPAAAVSEAWPVATMEAMAAKASGGAKAAERYTKSAGLLTAMADHTVARAGKLQDASLQGKAIADGLSRFKDQWIRMKAALYPADAEMRQIPVDMVSSRDLLRKFVQGKRDAARGMGAVPSDLKFYQRMLKAQEGELNAQEVRATMQELREGLNMNNAVATGDRAKLRKLLATMDADLDRGLAQASPEIGAQLRAANEAYRSGLLKINGMAGTAINKMARAHQYDKIAAAVANSRMSVDDVPRIREIVGDEGWQALQTSVLADIVNAAKHGTSSGESVLKPMGLATQIQRYGEDRLAAILNPDQLQRLKDLSTLSGSLQKGSKVIGGSQTGFITQKRLAIGALGAGGYAATQGDLGTPAEVLLLLAGAAGGRRFLASKVGQRWLTTGLPLSALAERTIQQGPRALSVPFYLGRQGPEEYE